ncbi:MAG: transketolase [Candidatus Woesearchaeota archaeon]|jgi:transketolase|nr:transketolase [Candidatus Woesearchaeota archaeon]|tara:strand:- start:629 stop:1456 length:828 start_codon:yes stop_codon:yes gene_type:complete
MPENITEEQLAQLKQKSLSIRKSILTMLTKAGSGHPGGSLSAADIVTILYFYKMKHDPKNPELEDRDRFVLSKGHACPLLYAVLSEAGYFPKEELLKLRQINSLLQGHPHPKTPGIEIATGSLGQGLSVANGIALAARLDNKDYKVYILLGDGESQEGQVWEAAMTSAHYKLNNLIAILDHNGLQIDGKTEEVMDVNPVIDKWKAFGWHVIEIDGHDYNQIIDALNSADAIKDKPVMIIANTIKGKGVSFMENNVGWHGKTPDEEQLKEALKELK